MSDTYFSIYKLYIFGNLMIGFKIEDISMKQ